jgi:hypothetical protein
MTCTISCQISCTPKRYRCDENSSYLFQEGLSSFEFQSKINLINETDYENKIENLVNDLSSNSEYFFSISMASNLSINSLPLKFVFLIRLLK